MKKSDFIKNNVGKIGDVTDKIVQVYDIIHDNDLNLNIKSDKNGKNNNYLNVFSKNDNTDIKKSSTNTEKNTRYRTQSVSSDAENESDDEDQNIHVTIKNAILKK